MLTNGSPQKNLPDMAIGQIVRRLRKLRGLTQLQLANAAGITPSGLAALEYGVNTDPRASTIKKLAHALQVTANDLLAEESLTGPAPKKRGKKR